MGNNGNEFGTEYVKVPETGLRYKRDKTIGQVNHEYFKDMTQKQRMAYHAKTSQILSYINIVTEESGDVLAKVEKLAEVCELDSIARNIAGEIDRHINANNMLAAEEIYRTKFIKLKHCEIKGALSPREIPQAFEKNRKIFGSFCRHCVQWPQLH